MIAQIGPNGIAFLEARGLSDEVAVQYGIYTASSVGGGEVLPDSAGDIIVFPFQDHERVVAEKYRTTKGDKKFWQRPNGRRTFWNSDVLDDPALADGREPLIITEGEIDALTAIDCRFPHTVSVPDGAPPPPKGTEDDEKKLDPATEQTGKFEFLWNNRERLKTIKRFTIATDNDAPGKHLAIELVRRLSAARCQFVEYPMDCKDLNEVLLRYGRDGVIDVLKGARPYPVRGLYRLSEYPDLPELETFSTGWITLDDVAGPAAGLRLFPGEFMVVTGIPGHGKTSWVLNLIVNLAEQYQWRTALFSPEMPTVPQLRNVLRTIKLKNPPLELDYREVERADAWINDMILFIDNDPTGKVELEFNLEWILDRATDAVLRDGVRILVIDPWNEIEHTRARDESLTDYIGRSIRMMRRWAQQYSVAVIVVAHPTKDVGKDGKARPVTLYDIDGSANWYNKPDHGVVVFSDDTSSKINIRKVRFAESGNKGEVSFRFDRPSKRYYPLDQH